MEIYADIVFLVNFIMDIFILWISFKLCNKKIRWPKIIIGGLVMSILYCILILFTQISGFLNVFISFLILVLGLLATYIPKSKKEFLKLIVFSYVGAFACGGIGMALFYMLDTQNGINTDNFSLKILIISSAAIYIIIKLSINWYKKIIINKQVFYHVKIFFDENNIIFNTLLDTGNSLYDPLSNCPVIIAEFNAIKNILPDKLRLIFYENSENDLSEIIDKSSDTNFYGRIRMIPFASLGKKNGIIIGFRPDKVEISNSENVIVKKDVIIGIYNCNLTKDGSYQGLLHPNLLH